MNNDKPILYLLGGNGSSKEWWKYSLPNFKSITPVPIDFSHIHSSKNFNSFNFIDKLAGELVKLTQPGSNILACGINALIVLRVCVKYPQHFNKIILFAPIGANLWKSKYGNLLSGNIFRKTAKRILSNNPKRVIKKLTDAEWSEDILNTVADGYKNTKLFEDYFKFVKPYNAIDLFEWIDNDIEIIWGAKDKVVHIENLPAWDSILARADLNVTIKENWGHYPYFEHLEEFANTVESALTNKNSFASHTKSGRLKLASLAKIKVPELFTIKRSDLPEFNKEAIQHHLSITHSSLLTTNSLFAVRSSSSAEDKTDSSSAGLYASFIRVKKEELAEKIYDVFSSGAENRVDEVIVQKFIEPIVSGVAFVRNISCEIEWVEGHLEELVSGKKKPFRAVVSEMKGEWQKNWNMYVEDAPFVLMLSDLAEFLKKCISVFQYRHSDIEWAWDGEKYYMLQIRPVTSYNWHRALTSANLDEILPKQVSKIMDHAQVGAASSISRIYALWYPEVLEDNEPFTVLYENASYINLDLYMAMFKRWGLPSKLLSKDIGGTTPELKFNLFRAVKSIPLFYKMIRVTRKYILSIDKHIKEFEEELLLLINSPLERRNVPTSLSGGGFGKAGDGVCSQEDKLVNWFVRYYMFIVRTNIMIKAANASSRGSFLHGKNKMYSKLDRNAKHRTPFESDPASPRDITDFKNVVELHQPQGLQKFFYTAGSLGFNNYFVYVREWFRDNNMRLFQRLHAGLQETEKGREWLEKFDSVREITGTFWADEGDVYDQDFSFVIYPGSVEGIVGEEKDILIVDYLDPGKYSKYKKYKAVVSRTGGKFSHGAILLRELKIPSAIISNIENDLDGKKVSYENGKISI